MFFQKTIDRLIDEGIARRNLCLHEVDSEKESLEKKIAQKVEGYLSNRKKIRIDLVTAKESEIRNAVETFFEKIFTGMPFGWRYAPNVHSAIKNIITDVIKEELRKELNDETILDNIVDRIKKKQLT